MNGGRDPTRDLTVYLLYEQSTPISSVLISIFFFSFSAPLRRSMPSHAQAQPVPAVHPSHPFHHKKTHSPPRLVLVLPAVGTGGLHGADGRRWRHGRSMGPAFFLTTLTTPLFSSLPLPSSTDKGERTGEGGFVFLVPSSMWRPRSHLAPPFPFLGCWVPFPSPPPSSLHTYNKLTPPSRSRARAGQSQPTAVCGSPGLVQWAGGFALQS